MPEDVDSSRSISSEPEDVPAVDTDGYGNKDSGDHHLYSALEVKSKFAHLSLIWREGMDRLDWPSRKQEPFAVSPPLFAGLPKQAVQSAI
jgi:hypothetical protein